MIVSTEKGPRTDTQPDHVAIEVNDRTTFHLRECSDSMGEPENGSNEHRMDLTSSNKSIRPLAYSLVFPQKLSLLVSVSGHLDFLRNAYALVPPKSYVFGILRQDRL